MKLPEKIQGRNLIRNGGICKDWVDYINSDDDFRKPAEIRNALAVKYELTERQIRNILRKNYLFRQPNREEEKVRRFEKLKLIEKGIIKSRKDITDILIQQRVEIEGDSVMPSGTQIHIYPHKVLIFRDMANGDNTNEINKIYAGENINGNRINGKL